MKLARFTLLAAGLATSTALSALPAGAQNSAHVGRIALQTADRMADDALRSMSSSQDPCHIVANLAKNASVNGLRGDFSLALASCVNEESGTPLKFLNCLRDALEDFADGLDELAQVQAARLDLCALTGGGIYDPDLDEDDFVEGVDHPYLPFRTGATWVYHAQTDEGLEVITVTVLDATRDVDDIESIVVRDVVTLDGVLIEDTIDWYAEDEDGNVWYMGEIAQNFEDGELSDLDGSWETGEDGALPGITMPAQPTVGTTYRQELLLTEAEDAATVLSTNAVVQTGMGTFTNCLQTADFTPLEPDALEYKFYAPGIGLVLEVKPETGERLELVSYTPGM